MSPRDIREKPLSGILLAGGKSSRMKRNKAFINLNNKLLYEYSLDILKMYAEDILISTSDQQFTSTGYRLIPDEQPGLGPLGGLYSCLKQIKNEYALVLPCDTPYINKDVTDLLTRDFKEYDCSILLNPANLPEPLIAIYSRKMIPLISERLSQGRLSIHELSAALHSNFIKLPTSLAHCIANINSPRDLENRGIGYR